MRLFLCGLILCAVPLAGCSHPTGVETFQEVHPEYGDRPSYFDKHPNYDGDVANDPFSNSDN